VQGTSYVGASQATTLTAPADGAEVTALELSEDARTLVLEARRALRPTLSDKQRVYSALEVRLAAGGVGGVAASTIMGKPLGGVVALALVVGGALLVNRRSADVTQAPVLESPRSSTQYVDEYVAVKSAEPSNSVVGVLGGDQAAATAPPAKVEPARQARKHMSPTTDGLAEEAALLMRAEKEYHSGNLDSAKGVVAQHARKFPTGLLAPERLELERHLMCAGQNDRAASSVANKAQVNGPGAAACPSIR
jgi:hypothetical protein